MEKSNGHAFPNDIKVNINNICYVVPAEPTPKEALFLSNIDLTVVFPVETIYLYRVKPYHDFANKIKEALSKVLVYYYPLAGRFKFNEEKKRMEIDCNGDGVLFAVADSELAIDELGEIGFVNPTFRSLVLNPLGLENPPIGTFQVTTFKCGGFAFGMCTSHAMLDGLSAYNFLQDLTTIADGEDIKVKPNFDRTSLKARDPPRITYNHIELMEIPKEATTIFTQGDVNQEIQDLTKVSSTHAYRSFPFSSKLLRRIKEMAIHEGGPCSTFEAVLAHIWQARVRSMEGLDDNPEQPMMVLFAVDIRKHATLHLPNNFCGNGVTTAYAHASAREIKEKPLSFCVQKVQEGIRRVTPDYIMSSIDWFEVHKGIPAMGSHGNFYLSAWWKLPFHKVAASWGMPMYAGPIMTGIVDMVLLVSNCSPDEGLNLLIALPTSQMVNFENHIHIQS